jgi:hypothetical protein
MRKNKDTTYNCRVCGLNQGVEPWGKDGETPSFDICTCCGVQFGYEDCDILSVKKFRAEWLNNGAHWSWAKNKPENWSLEEQMQNIPDDFK